VELERLDSLEGVIDADLMEQLDRAHDFMSRVVEDLQDAGL
jgi:hypothetical protein